MLNWNNWFDWEAGLTGLKILIGIVLFVAVLMGFVLGGIYGYNFLEKSIGMVGAITALCFYCIPCIYIIFSFVAKAAQ